jgi:hypothetical protein
MREVRMKLTVDLDNEMPDGRELKIDDPAVRAFIVRALEGESIEVEGGNIVIDAVVADPA